MENQSKTHSNLEEVSDRQLVKTRAKTHSNLEEVSDRQLGKTRAKKHSNLEEVSDRQLGETRAKNTATWRRSQIDSLEKPEQKRQQSGGGLR